jgi:hypothetical protein
VLHPGRYWPRSSAHDRPPAARTASPDSTAPHGSISRTLAESTHSNESTTKACSLASELEQLEHVAEAVTVLTNLVRDKRTANDDEATRLPILSAAVTSMLGSRLRDLRRVVRGQRDPGEFWSPACDASPSPSANDDQDVRFPAWSDGEPAEGT